MFSEEYGPRVARYIVIVVAVCFFAASVVATAGNRDGLPHLSGALIFLVPVLGLHLLHSAPAALRRRRPWWPWSLVVHGTLTYLPYLIFQGSWVGIPGSFEAALLLTLPLPHSWAVFAGAVGLQFPLTLAVGETTGQAVSALISATVGGLAVYGVARLADLAGELNAARSELAREAVGEERVRFARDLHDLCGYSLSAVALKCELVHGLVSTDPRRAQAELLETQVMVREVLAEVRSVSAGYRNLSLAKEATAAASLLETAGAEVVTDLAAGPLPPGVDGLFATVVREGFTNVMRHSKARRCSIVVRIQEDAGTVRLTMSNDGAPVEGTRAPAVVRGRCPGAGGSGIRNLAERSAELEGSLSAVTDREGWFRLTVTVPLVRRSAPRRGHPAVPRTLPGGLPGAVPRHAGTGGRSVPR
ncbi:sensor histidine kinase [Streptomyces sp. NPDC056987]|uniref:sensor histidine kinase n=1 Tax=Streptomyces sp. NPDC056987 TaxID=3345988 RepID=UPI00362E1C67